MRRHEKVGAFVQMRATRTNPCSLVEWGVAARTMPGQAVSGDMHFVQPFEDGVLVAVVDGLGHGEEASIAARPAISVLEQHAEEPVITLMKRCHEALMETRGAVITLASFRESDSTLACLSVGNVAGVLLRANTNAIPPSDACVMRPGVVGFQMPALRASVFTVSPGDLLILTSDGIYADFEHGMAPAIGAQQIADNIIKRYFKGSDDGLALVVRYLGRPDERLIA